LKKKKSITSTNLKHELKKLKIRHIFKSGQDVNKSYQLSPHLKISSANSRSESESYISMLRFYMTSQKIRDAWRSKQAVAQQAQ